MPLNNLTFVGTRHDFLSVLHPFYLKKRSFMSIFALAHEIGTRRFPIRVKSLTTSFLLGPINIDKRFICGENVLGKWVIRINAWPVLRIKVIIVILLIVINLKVVRINLLPVLWYSPLVHVGVHVSELVHLILVTKRLLIHHLRPSWFHYKIKNYILLFRINRFWSLTLKKL